MTSAVDIVVTCPHCRQPNRRLRLASLSARLLRHWSDGCSDPVPPPSVLHRCGACGTADFREAFTDLGWLRMADTVDDIDLVSPGPDRVKTMQVLRRFTGVDLHAAQSLLQRPPTRIATGLCLDDSARLAGMLRAVGAEYSVQIREVAPGNPASWFEAPLLQDASDVETLLMRLAAPDLDDNGEAALRLALYQHWNAPFREASAEWVPGDRRDAAQQSNAHRLSSLLREDDDCQRLLKANLARERADFASAATLLSSDFGDIEPLAVGLRALVEASQSAVSVLE